MTYAVPSLGSEVREIIAVTDTAQLHASQAREGSTEIHERTDRLRARILAGETTGSPICDFVILRWGIDETCEAAYRKLERSLEGMEGQFILSIRLQRGQELTETRRLLHLGVIAREKLFINTPPDSRCWIALTGAAGTFDHPESAQEWERIIDLSGYGFLQQERLRYHPSEGYDESDPAQRILIGDMAVKQWFAEEEARRLLRDEKGTATALFARMAALAGRPLDEAEFSASAEKQPRQEGLQIP